MAIAAVSLTALVVHVRRAQYPLVDPRLWGSRVFASASASLLLGFIATFAVAVFMPFYFEQLRGLPAERAGLLLMPLPLTIATVAPFTGAIADRIGTQKLAASGMFIVACGLAWLTTIDEHSSFVRVVGNLLVIGIGQATFQPPNNSALMGAAPRERQGVAAGVLASGRVLGQSLSVALAGGLFGFFGGTEAARALRGGDLSGPAVHAFLQGMHASLTGCALVALAASVTALVRGSDRSPALQVR
jgi:MFS family permease